MPRKKKEAAEVVVQDERGPGVVFNGDVVTQFRGIDFIPGEPVYGLPVEVVDFARRKAFFTVIE